MRDGEGPSSTSLLSQVMSSSIHGGYTAVTTKCNAQPAAPPRDCCQERSRGPWGYRRSTTAGIC